MENCNSSDAIKNWLICEEYELVLSSAIRVTNTPECALDLFYFSNFHFKHIGQFCFGLLYSMFSSKEAKYEGSIVEKNY